MPVLSYISCISGYTSHHGKKWDIMFKKRQSLTDVLKARLRDLPPTADEPREYVRIMPTVLDQLKPVNQSVN